MKMMSLALAAGMLGATALTAHAAVVIASAAFSDLGAPLLYTSTGAADKNLATATKFTIGNPTSLYFPGVGRITVPLSFVVTGSAGALSTLTTNPAYESDLAFGPITFSTTDANSLSFGNSAFGHFASDYVLVEKNAQGVQQIYFRGEWTAGAASSLPGQYEGSIIFTFNQVGGSGAAVSDSASFAVPPAAIPELSSWGLMGLGFGGLGAAACRSSRRSVSIVA